MSKVLLVHGAPGVGKSVLATDVYLTLSKQGKSVHYVQEFIKDLANRKYAIDPVDQIGIFGNQTMIINGAIQAEYEFVSCCSSPLLCSFYANYYSNNSLMSLVDTTNNWLDYLETKFNVKFYNFFIYLEKEDYTNRFKQNGRYEGLDDALHLQDSMLKFYETHYPNFTMIDHNYTSENILGSLND